MHWHLSLTSPTCFFFQVVQLVRATVTAAVPHSYARAEIGSDMDSADEPAGGCGNSCFSFTLVSCLTDTLCFLIVNVPPQQRTALTTRAQLNDTATINFSNDRETADYSFWRLRVVATPLALHASSCMARVRTTRH